MAFYSPDFLDRVRSASDLAQVVSGYNVQLKRVGLNLVGLCPFHNEKTPSFSVKTSDQVFRCFGCGAKGNVFTFVQMMEKVEFPEAVRMLAERAGLPVEHGDPAQAREAARREQTKTALLWCCSRALDYFEENLKQSAGDQAREYLLSRGFTRETIERWRLGWAPDSWDGLCGFLLKSAKEPDQKEKVLGYASQVGLLRAKEGASGSSGRRHYDAFRGRVMFPILDFQRRPIAFGGRVLVEKPEAGGKYINSSENRLFEKRKVLFGLPQAAKAISLTGEAVVVEGYVDAIMCHQYGVENVVAVLGTALTEDHVALLRRHLPQGKGRVIALFDSDSAGERAAEKSIELFMAQDVPLAVVGGLDPKDAGDFLPRHGAEEFRKRLAKAEDSFSHIVARTLGRAKGKDLAAVGLAVREAMRVVNLCPDPIKLALMRQSVAVEAGVPEETLPGPAVSRPAARRAVTPRRTRPSVKPGLAPPVSGLEMEEALERAGTARKNREARLLRYMWENRDWCAAAVDAHPPGEWWDPELAELAEHIRDAWDNDRPLSVAAISAEVENPAAAERLADLAFPDDEPLSEKELSRLLSLLRDEDVQERMRRLRDELSRAQRDGDAAREGELLAEYLRLQSSRKK